MAEWFGCRTATGDPKFKSHSDHLPDLFQVVPDSTPRLNLYIAN